MNTLRKQFDPEYVGTRHDIQFEETKTIPDMHVSIPKMLENHARGLAGLPQREGYYFEDLEIPRFDDLNDVKDYRENLKKEYDKVQAHIKEIQQKQKEAAEAAKKKEEEEELIKNAKAAEKGSE